MTLRADIMPYQGCCKALCVFEASRKGKRLTSHDLHKAQMRSSGVFAPKSLVPSAIVCFPGIVCAQCGPHVMCVMAPNCEGFPCYLWPILVLFLGLFYDHFPAVFMP